MYRTTSYQIQIPAELWTEFKQVHDDRDRYNSRIAELVAQDVVQHRSGELGPQVEAAVERILGGDSV